MQKSRFNEDVDEEVKSIRNDAALKLKSGLGLQKSRTNLDSLTVHSGLQSLRSGVAASMVSKQIPKFAADKLSDTK